MKFLINGYFQWIAFNTETFQFSDIKQVDVFTRNKYLKIIPKMEWWNTLKILNIFQLNY